MALFFKDGLSQIQIEPDTGIDKEGHMLVDTLKFYSGDKRVGMVDRSNFPMQLVERVVVGSNRLFLIDFGLISKNSVYGEYIINIQVLKLNSDSLLTDYHYVQSLGKYKLDECTLEIEINGTSLSIWMGVADGHEKGLRTDLFLHNPGDFDVFFRKVRMLHHHRPKFKKTIPNLYIDNI
ncbi:MAG: hypothetical protein IPP17_22920 [Bacteroidetes bacterium]|nr:hypothetical protein [Bacteroidota bacterium]